MPAQAEARDIARWRFEVTRVCFVLGGYGDGIKGCTVRVTVWVWPFWVLVPHLVLAHEEAAVAKVRPHLLELRAPHVFIREAEDARVGVYSLLHVDDQLRLELSTLAVHLGQRHLERARGRREGVKEEVAVVVVGIGYGVYTWTRRGRGAFTRWGCAVGQPL